MCEICDGAKSTSEMPCSKVLTEFGIILYQVVGGGPAAQMAMQTAGGLHSPSEKGREVYGNLLYGIHLGRAEEIRTREKAASARMVSGGTKCSLVFGALRGSSGMGVFPSADVQCVFDTCGRRPGFLLWWTTEAAGTLVVSAARRPLTTATTEPSSATSRRRTPIQRALERVRTSNSASHLLNSAEAHGRGVLGGGHRSIHSARKTSGNRGQAQAGIGRPRPIDRARPRQGSTHPVDH